GIIDGEALGHNNIGLIYVSQGRLREAADEYSKTLALLQVSGDKLGRATTLNNIGNAYTRLGEFQKALGYLLQGLDLARSIGDQRREAYNLASIGFLYIRLEGWLAIWEPMEKIQGLQGLATVFDPQQFDKQAEDKQNNLIVLKAGTAKPVSYWAGFARDRAGKVTSADAWKKYVDE